MRHNRNHLNDIYSTSRPRHLSESEYTVRPKTKDELVEIIKVAISEEGDNCDLNFIDVSGIKDMRYLFSYKYGFDSFNGDISEWDVSNVEDMYEMFTESDFNSDISKWDVSNVKNMRYMFAYSKFNQDISDWDVSYVEDMRYMFAYSKFNQDISDWDVSYVKNAKDMFTDTKIKDEYKPQLKTNESRYSRSLTESRNRIPTHLRRFI